VQATFGRDTLDRADVLALGLQRGHEATVDEQAIDFNGASAALPFTAAFFRAGEASLFTQNIEEPSHGVGFERELPVVDATPNANFARRLRHDRCPEFRAALQA
jgi:hypothetical protein